MWLTKKILVPTDLAETSRAACDAGLELARRLRVPLALLHVYPVPSTIYSGDPIAPGADYVQLLQDSAQSALNNEGARLQGKGVDVTTILRMGTPWEQILDVVDKLDIGLIVMGTHGRRGLSHALLGSVAEKVVRFSRVPVLTVHGEQVTATEATSAIAGSSIRR
jgi:nucleotide-binding universal stress UspA family protein